MGLRTWLGLKERRIPTDVSLEVARKSRPRNLLGITCSGKTDGGGAQVHAVMSAIAFSQAIGVPYFHTPFRSVAHSADPTTFAARWEAAFNLGIGHEAVPNDVPLIDSQQLLSGYNGPPAILRQEYFHKFTDRNPHLYLPLAKVWRDALSLPDLDDPGEVLAVHIRRGDVGPHTPERFTPNDKICRSIEHARKNGAGKAVILSEGDPSEFEWLPPDCRCELGTDIFETVATMVRAKNLIMSKSSLSYICGLLSRGTVYYEKFWHSTLPSWRVLD